MKTNDKQKEICDFIIEQANFWKNSNDINSPTHFCDIHESLYNLDWLSDEQINEIEDLLCKLYIKIKHLNDE